MKTFIIPPLLILISLSCIVLPNNAQLPDTDKSKYIGTWISEDNNLQKWVFTKEKLTVKHPGRSDYVYSYTLSASSPQCGRKVPTDVGFTFLSIKEISTNDTTCFYVNGFAETTPGRKTLSISEFNRTGALILIKQ